MLVLFDNGTPRTLARFLIDHHMVTESRARGWEELENGELLNEAEAAGFKVLVTTTTISAISRILQAARLRLSYWVRGGGVSSNPMLRRLSQRCKRPPQAALPRWTSLTSRNTQRGCFNAVSAASDENDGCPRRRARTVM